MTISCSACRGVLSFSGNWRHQPGGGPAAGAGRQVNRPAACVKVRGFDMQAVVRVAFECVERPVAGDDLFEDGDLKDAPQPVMLGGGQQWLSSLAEHDHGVREIHQPGQRFELRQCPSNGLRLECWHARRIFKHANGAARTESSRQNRRARCRRDRVNEARSSPKPHIKDVGSASDYSQQIFAEDRARVGRAKADLIQRAGLLLENLRVASRGEIKTNPCRTAAAAVPPRQAPAGTRGADPDADSWYRHPAVGAGRVQIHVGAQIGQHQRLAEIARAEVRHDDGHLGIAQRHGVQIDGIRKAHVERRTAVPACARTPTLSTPQWTNTARWWRCGPFEHRLHADRRESRNSASRGTGRRRGRRSKVSGASRPADSPWRRRKTDRDARARRRLRTTSSPGTLAINAACATLCRSSSATQSCGEFLRLLRRHAASQLRGRRLER